MKRRRGALLELKYTLNAFNRKVIVLVCLEKTSCYLYMLSGMFFSVAGFTLLSIIRQGYYIIILLYYNIILYHIIIMLSEILFSVARFTLYYPTRILSALRASSQIKT